MIRILCFLCDFRHDYEMFCVASCENVTNTLVKRFKVKRVLKSENGFWDTTVLRLHCASPHIMCFAKRVMRQRLGCGSWVFVSFIMRLYANVFGVGPESDDEALTDRWSRP